MTQRQLGDAIGTVYCEGLSTLARLLDAQDDPAALTQDGEALKASRVPNVDSKILTATKRKLWLE
jgi:hypothetical protein